MEVKMDLDAVEINKQPRSVSQRSLIWSVFEQWDGDQDGDSMKCMICGKVVKRSGGTRNLWQHVERHHKARSAELQSLEIVRKSVKRVSRKRLTFVPPEAAAAPAHGQASGTSSRKARQSTSQKHADNALLYFVAKDLQPCSLVENEGFLEFIRALGGNYSVPSQHIVESMIEAKHVEIASQVSNELYQLCCVSITAELWTNATTEAYLTIAVHAINSDFLPRNFVLNTQAMPEKYTSENIAEALESAVKVWKLEGKVVAVVTNNEASMNEAVAKLIQKGICGMHFHCFGHTLKSCFEDGLKSQPEITDTVRKFHDIVSLFHRSILLTEDLKNAQITLGMPEKELVLDAPTDWSSTCKMLRSVIDSEQPINLALLSSKTTVQSPLDERDFDLAHKLLDVLDAFEEAATVNSGGQYVTIAVVHPLIQHLINSVDTSHRGEMAEAETDDVQDGSMGDLSLKNSKIISRLKEELMKNLQHRFQDVIFNNCYRFSSFLDPRFKSTYGEVPEVIAFATQETIKLQTSCLPATSENPEIASSKPDSVIPDANTNRQRCSFWETVENTNVAAKKARLQSGSGNYREINIRIHAELACYKREEPLGTGGDVYTYWKERETRLPLLSCVAQKFLCTPASCLASDQIFSAAGQVFAARRCCLEPNNVDRLVFLNRNWNKM